MAKKTMRFRNTPSAKVAYGDDMGMAIKPKFGTYPKDSLNPPQGKSLGIPPKNLA